MQHQLVDCLSRDVDQVTARQRALINSAFYRILIKEEGEQIRRFIRQREIYLLQKSTGKAGSGGLMNLMGEHHSLLLGPGARSDQQRFGPTIKVFRNQEEEAQTIQNMQKTYRSETSVNMVFDTVRSNSNRLNPGARKTNVKAGSSTAAPRPMFGVQKLQSSRHADSKKFAFFPGQLDGVHDLAEEAGSVGSPKTSLFTVPGNMATKKKLRIGAGGPIWVQDEAEAGLQQDVHAAKTLD